MNQWLVSCITWPFFQFYPQRETLIPKSNVYYCCPCGLATHLNKMPKAISVAFVTILWEARYMLSELVLSFSTNLWRVDALWVPNWLKGIGNLRLLRNRRDMELTKCYFFLYLYSVSICDGWLTLRTFSLVCKWMSPNTLCNLFTTNVRRKFLSFGA